MLPPYQKVDLTIHFCFSILDPATQLLRLEMIMKLEAKIAVVTGSTSGIGAATARALSRERPQVTVAGRDGERGRSGVESLRAGDERLPSGIPGLPRGMAAEICEMIIRSSGKAIGLRAERLARSRDRETRRDL
jgi:NAD(P)-dependent dehydrogenase (short-subunit alcohol dehydrogenase family)